MLVCTLLQSLFTLYKHVFYTINRTLALRREVERSDNYKKLKYDLVYIGYITTSATVHLVILESLVGSDFLVCVSLLLLFRVVYETSCIVLSSILLFRPNSLNS